jgi:hypothetical protein
MSVTSKPHVPVPPLQYEVMHGFGGLGVHWLESVQGIVHRPFMHALELPVHGVPTAAVGVPGLPCVHVAAMQVPTSTAVPSATGVCAQLPDVHASVVQGFLSSHSAGLAHAP